jgi:hypothetical protein
MALVSTPVMNVVKTKRVLMVHVVKTPARRLNARLGSIV